MISLKKSKEIVTINKNDVDVYKDHVNGVMKINDRILKMRKRQIFESLRVSAHQRVKTMGRIDKWIEILEAKLFSPEVLEEIDLNKLIALFKYTNNMNLKILMETDRLEVVLTNYLKSGALELAEKLPEGELQETTPENIAEMKKDIHSLIQRVLAKNCEEAEIAEASYSKKEKELSDATEKLDKEIESEIVDDLKALNKEPNPEELLDDLDLEE
jgi:phenylalanyl-tRNA synthetase alpha subunit